VATRAEKCNSGGKTLNNGNCTNPGDDGLPVQCVGPWAQEKHDYLRRYIEATTGPRAKFLVQARGRPAGGAAFVDLFSGPGMARVRTTGTIIDGSPLIAAKHTTQRFSKLIFVDLAPENCQALEQRVNAAGRSAKIIHGDCNDKIGEVISEIPPHGLNIALVDPYGLIPLSFETLRRLASVKRMDLVIHFPTMDIKRNFDRAETYIRHFLGTAKWKSTIKEAQQAVLLIDILREQLATLFSYEKEKVRSLPIKNEQGGVLYHLVFATKDPLGNKMWESIARTDAKGQKDLFPR
jgi:three-Cys-motif partner protein